MNSEQRYDTSTLFFMVLLTLGISESLQGLFQWYQTSDRGIHGIAVGSFHNSGPYAIFLSLILPSAWFYIIKMIKYGLGNKLLEITMKLMSLVFTLLSVFILPLSEGRTGWIATITGCLTVTFLCLKVDFQLSVKKMCVFAITAFVLISVFAIPIYKFKQDSADGRLLIWKISMSIIAKHPLTGVGHGLFAGEYGEAQKDYFINDKGTEQEKRLAGAPDYPYNEYIHITVEHGIIGLTVLMLILSYAFINLSKSELEGKIALSGMLISLCTAMFFSYPFHIFKTCVLSLCIIVGACIFPRRFYGNSEHVRNMLIHALVFSTLIISSSAYFGKMGNKRITYNQWHSLQAYYNDEKYEDICPLYAVLYPYLHNEAEYMLEYGRILSHLGQYNTSNKILHQGTKISADPMFWNIMGKNLMEMGMYNEAENMFHSAYYRIPHKKYPLYLLMLLYDKSGHPEKSLEMANRILTSPDKVKSEESEWLRNKAKTRLNI